MSDTFSPGTFVRTSEGRVGEVLPPINGQPDDEIRICLFRPFSVAKEDFQSPQQPLGVIRPEYRGVKELVASSGEVFSVVYTTVEVVFIFHLEELEDVWPHICVKGMSHIYLYRFNELGQIAPRPQIKLHSKSHIIWACLVAIQESLRKILGRISQYQGTVAKGKQQIRITIFTWEFIKAFAKNCCQGNGKVRKSIKRKITAGLEVQSCRKSRTTELIRFETTADLLVFIALFGETAIADVRKKRPRLREGPSKLVQYDVVNVVVGSEDRPEEFILDATADGVDLEFDGDSLTITVRYQSYVVRQTSVGRELLECPCDLLEKLIRREDLLEQEDAEAQEGNNGHGDVMIYENEQFLLNNRLYSVVRFDKMTHQVECKCIYPPNVAGEVCTFDSRNDDIAALIQNHLTG